MFYVAPTGNDDGAGTAESPFRTVSRCASAAAEPTRCVVAHGVYRERVSLSTRSGAAVTIEGDESSPPTLSGLELLEGLQWRPGPARCSFTATLPPSTASFQQLFHNGAMMLEARWPNLDINRLEQQLFDRAAAWAPTADGSAYGTIVAPDLAAFNFSWTGALATLQVAHQFCKSLPRRAAVAPAQLNRRPQSRGRGAFRTTVLGMTASRTQRLGEAQQPHGACGLTVRQDLPGLAGWEGAQKGWNHNQFVLSGVLGALDAPGEWFRDGDQLHFIPPTAELAGGCAPPPAAGAIEVKARDYALFANCTSAGPLNVTLTATNLHLVGAAAKLPCCQDCTIRNVVMVRRHPVALHGPGPDPLGRNTPRSTGRFPK